MAITLPISQNSVSESTKQRWKVKVDDLKHWAERCEREGRFAQSILVRNIVWEIEQGAPWLEIMAEHNIEVPAEEVK